MKRVGLMQRLIKIAVWTVLVIVVVFIVVTFLNLWPESWRY